MVLLSMVVRSSDRKSICPDNLSVLAALGVAWAVDLLFWNTALGVNFTLWMGMALADPVCRGAQRAGETFPADLAAGGRHAGAGRHHLHPQPAVHHLHLAAAFHGLPGAGDHPPSRHANWPFYRLVDYIKTVLQLSLALLIRPPEVYSGPNPRQPRGTLTPTAGEIPLHLAARAAHCARAVVALPVVLVFATLLATAELISATR